MLVSCVMPTKDRPRRVSRAIDYFRHQDYPDRELIIVYEKPADLPCDIPESQGIRLLRVSPGMSIGAKRNLACAVSKGAVIAQWDDDDWHGPARLSNQVQPIAGGWAEISALTNTLFFDERRRAFCEASPELFQSMFAENVLGGSLVFLSRVWTDLAHYPDTWLREDADFMLQAMRRGARLCRLNGRCDYVYVRHACNTWRWDFQSAGHCGSSGVSWSRACVVPPGAGELLEEAVTGPWNPRPGSPRVSCIMPTRDRPEYAQNAVDNFLAQDYPDKELIILDNGVDGPPLRIKPGVPVRYERVPYAPLGELRNRACQLSTGDLISIWDDDDWRASDWLSQQARIMTACCSDACGLDRVLFHDPRRRMAWTYTYPAQTGRPWACGGTLCFTRSLWRRSPFPPVHVGEDALFLWQCADLRLTVNPYWRGYIATIHSGNTSPKATHTSLWRPTSIAVVDSILAHS